MSMLDDIPSPLPLTACPEYRPENIHHIIETVERYHTAHQIALEEYVHEQMEKNQYDRSACLAVLKMYQFNPPLTNYSIIVNILSLALGALPDPDFNLCLCLLSEDIMTNNDVAKLILLQQSLEQCRFQEFWKLMKSETDGEPMKKLVADYPAFYTQIREFISNTVAISFHKIEQTRLEGYLDLKGKDVTSWIEKHGWTFDPSDKKVVLIPAKFNQAKPVNIKESVKFEQLAKIVGHARLAL